MCSDCGDFGYLPKPDDPSAEVTAKELAATKKPCQCVFGEQFRSLQEEWNISAMEHRKAS